MESVKSIDKAVLYNPKTDNYKTPFGAVKTYELISLRLYVLTQLSANGVDLILRKDSSEIQNRLHFKRVIINNNYTEYTISFDIKEAGLYFYRFELIKGDIIYFCGKNDNDDTAAIADWLPEWQLTVYDKSYTTPDWFAGGVIYQIFVDRFCKGRSPDLVNVKKDYILRDDWGSVPMYERAANGDMKTNDFFGGNLDGINSKLDYLSDLGVTCIYLSPIFEAYSNHKYDTADYMNIDPMFGDNEEFKKLCANALSKGIRIILDGVFSHTGSDSIYFNKEQRYGIGGAYNDKESPYFSWYTFKKWPEDYLCWWGIKILPSVREDEKSYLEYMTGENGVLRYWLNCGASGWRIDVADELTDIFLDKLRLAVKDEKEDSIIIGEVWEDASNKVSYGIRRRYLLGEQLDSVMNYPFKNAILEFLKYGAAEEFKKSIMNILQNYPGPSINCLMNIVGTHDTVRILTGLSGIDGSKLSLNERSGYKMSENDYEKAKKLLMLAAAIQFTLPGVPCIYYGDEAGMQGYEDPFNRRCYPWGREDAEILNWYKKLGKIRNVYRNALQGNMKILIAQGGLIAYSRGDKLVIAVNAGETPMRIDFLTGEYLNLTSYSENDVVTGGFELNSRSCMILIRFPETK